MRLSTFILSGKYKGFMFVHPVSVQTGWTNKNLFHLQDPMEFNSLRKETYEKYAAISQSNNTFD